MDEDTGQDNYATCDVSLDKWGKHAIDTKERDTGRRVRRECLRLGVDPRRSGTRRRKETRKKLCQEDRQ